MACAMASLLSFPATFGLYHLSIFFILAGSLSVPQIVLGGRLSDDDIHHGAPAPIPCPGNRICNLCHPSLCCRSKGSSQDPPRLATPVFSISQVLLRVFLETSYRRYVW
jgi:hypothetical protein